MNFGMKSTALSGTMVGDWAAVPAGRWWVLGYARRRLDGGFRLELLYLREK